MFFNNGVDCFALAEFKEAERWIAIALEMNKHAANPVRLEAMLHSAYTEVLQNTAKPVLSIEE